MTPFLLLPAAMFDCDQYELLDFGQGRKLERFGPYLLDRPCPAAQKQKLLPAEDWKNAHARYNRSAENRGRWSPAEALPKSWTIEHGSIRFELKPTEFGHVGLFVEQACNWDWIAAQVRRAGRPLKVLNLFAYTGGSTLAAAAEGAEVVHVDSAKNIVAWAKRNAALSKLGQAQIRWICEDAQKFVEREIRRGNRYDAVILDPPSYGHGPKGEVWKITKSLSPLLAACGELTSASRAFMLLTCHSPGFGPAELEAATSDALFGRCQMGAAARRLSITTSSGRRLPGGVSVRWPS